MSTTFTMTRRSILAGAAFAGAVAPFVAASAVQANEEIIEAKAAPVDLAGLERVKVELVKPPFVHAHSQKAEGGPKVYEFT
jgi:nitrite reductase (NO-forming)